jgi:Tfp pilus assembly protein PilF
MVLGKDYPSTLKSRNNLAEVLRNQGKYKQAEEMHRRALGLSQTSSRFISPKRIKLETIS